ncbi:MAG: hypothetical protein ACOC8L_08265 [Spirochaetota bacterium]
MKSKVALLSLVAGSIILAGCSTLPRPSSPDEGLLVIAVRHANETGDDYFGNYKLAIKDGDERHSFQTLTEDRSLVVAAVPAGGPYTLETEFWYESGARAGTFQRHSSTIVRAGVRH